MAADVICAARHGAVGSGHDLTWGILQDTASLRLLADEWSALLRPGQFFLAPAWVLHWLHWQRDDVMPHVLVAQDGRGRLRGLLPLARTRSGTLTPCGAEEGALGLDVVAASRDATAIARGSMALLERTPWRRIRLRGVLAGGALHGALRRAAPGLLYERVSTYCPYVGTAVSWDDFLAAQGKHQRHELRRKLRRSLEAPATSVRWVFDPAEVPAVMRALFDLHALRFDAAQRKSNFTGEDLEAFHIRFAQELAGRGELILGLLEHEGRAVAAIYGFRCRGVAGLFQSGFDPETDVAAAGEVLRIELLRRMTSAEDQHELDLLDGCYPWKLRLASGVRRQFDVEIHSASARGLLGWFLRRGLATMRRRVLTVLRGSRCPGQCGPGIQPDHCRRAGCPDADEHHRRAA